MCYRSLCFIKVVCKSLLLTGITALVKTYSCQPLSIVNSTLVNSKLASSKLVNTKLVNTKPVTIRPVNPNSLKSFYSESTVNFLIAANLFINALISINAPIADFFGIQSMRKSVEEL